MQIYKIYMCLVPGLASQDAYLLHRLHSAYIWSESFTSYWPDSPQNQFSGVSIYDDEMLPFHLCYSYTNFFAAAILLSVD
jgi:hypothetical protein